MIYTPMNTDRAKVHNFDTGKDLVFVSMIDTDRNEVTLHKYPFGVLEGGFETYTVSFRSIYPIFGDSFSPQLFCLHGQIEDRQPEKERVMTKLDSTGTTAVDSTYYWQPIDTCPHGVKVQLKGAGGVAHYGVYHGIKDDGNFWIGWAPLPTDKKEKD